MALYTTYFFVTDSGRSPVKEFIDSLDPRSQRKFFYVKSLLEEFGHKLPIPHAKYIGNDIYELRFSGIEGNIRILYFFFHQSSIIFIQGFIKKTGKIPHNEILTAIQRKKSCLGDMTQKDGAK